MPRFRRKPVELDAVRWRGNNFAQITEFLKDGESSIIMRGEGTDLQIATLEGLMTARQGDWIVRGTAGELYPVKPDIFKEIYEPIGAGSDDDEQERTD